jgi:hypothetical protein
VCICVFIWVNIIRECIHTCFVKKKKSGKVNGLSYKNTCLKLTKSFESSFYISSNFLMLTEIRH